MTTNNEKAIEILIKHTEDIQEEIGSGCEYCDEKRSVNCISSCWVSDVDVALDSLPKVKEELEKAEKYKWHDLRKDPNDLPDGRKSSQVVYITKDLGRYSCTAFTLCLYFENVNRELGYVIAWKYEEPFEEVEDEQRITPKSL